MVLIPLIPLPRQTPPGNLDIRADILDQSLHPGIIILRPDIPQDHQVHARVVEVVGEGVHDVDFDAADGVFVERIVADGEDAGEDVACWDFSLVFGFIIVGWRLVGGFRTRGGALRGRDDAAFGVHVQAGPAVVDA